MLTVGRKHMEDEEFTEPPPPSAERVARRAIMLSVVSCRGIVEGNKTNPTGGADLARRSYDWLRAISVEEDATDWERQLLTAPFGSLADRDRINASWLSEAVAVLAYGRSEGWICPRLRSSAIQPVLQTVWGFSSRPIRPCSISHSFSRTTISGNTTSSSIICTGEFEISL